MPFNEVLRSGEPDFPFCLCWANHSWKAKTWDPAVPDRMLMEQTYPGIEDYKKHFYALLPAFKDKRYIKVEGKLLFGIFDPGDISDIGQMARVWNTLAEENQLPGFCFFAFAQGSGALQNTKDPAYNMVVYDAMFDAVYIHNHDRRKRIQTRWKSLFHRASPIEYDYYTRCARQKFSQYPEAIPCIDPNFDHSPRSGTKGVILHNSSPEKWGRFCADVARSVDNPDKNGLLFIKSWNEWGEGNYLEPDLRFGSRYLEETAKALK